MQAQAVVYWIHLPEHTDPKTEGYLGVSKRFESRMKDHFKDIQEGKHKNTHLVNAVNKYGWDNLIKEILVIGEDKYCYELELKLRSHTEIGWNLAIGGGKPPVTKFRGDDYVSPLKGVPRPTPWLIGKSTSPSVEACRAGGLKRKGIKQTTEQVAKRVASRRATLASQGRTH